MATKKKPTGRVPKSKASNATAEKAPWSFPKNKLDNAIRVAQVIEEKNAGRPTRSEDLAKLLGYTSVNDWRFLDLLKSANQYGLVTGSGRKAIVNLAPTGTDIVAPSSQHQRQKALLAAFHNVEKFKAVADYYAGKKIPDDEFFGNLLVRDFGVPRERVQHFISVFLSNLNFVHGFVSDVSAQPSASKPDERPLNAEVPLPQEPADEAGIVMKGRQFLDFCFIMMPFGPWFDRYYKEIYQPACKDAGLEPIRADSLFSSGSVMEQIWEQIKNSKVLLAELTGKNPNVFYELGLAHAARKPVVFVTADIDDVPFDLRHLRVVVYDIRDPAWAQKLRAEIVAYLKNAKTDPTKSIPQPFRDEQDQSIP
jgi:hypothetical protein